MIVSIDINSDETKKAMREYYDTMYIANNIWRHVKGCDIPDHWDYNDWIWIIKKYWHNLGEE